METLRKEFTYSLRERVPLSLIMFSVDHFKIINDLYGHQAGDYVLTRIAQRVSDTIRTEDLLARYASSEFALMIRDCTEEPALACAEQCRRAVDRSDFIFAGTPIKVTISLGVATMVDADFETPEHLVYKADMYRHRAIRAGRNRVDAAAVSDR